MQEVLFFYLANCPYCIRARLLLEQIRAEQPDYADVPFREIEEREEPELAAGFDYYLVPAFFVDGEKVHEGIPTKRRLLKVFRKAVNA